MNQLMIWPVVFKLTPPTPARRLLKEHPSPSRDASPASPLMSIYS